MQSLISIKELEKIGLTDFSKVSIKEAIAKAQLNKNQLSDKSDYQKQLLSGQLVDINMIEEMLTEDNISYSFISYETALSRAYLYKLKNGFENGTGISILDVKVSTAISLGTLASQLKFGEKEVIKKNAPREPVKVKKRSKEELKVTRLKRIAKRFIRQSNEKDVKYMEELIAQREKELSRKV